jgi:hypothetical protein
MSQEVLLELKYELNRWQRLIPHFWVWFPYLPTVLTPLLVPFFISVSAWYILVVLPILYLSKEFFYGLLDVIINPNIPMDVVVEENRLGYMCNDYRLWMRLSEVLIVGNPWSGIWTVYHYNSTVINIPISAISKEQLEVFCSAVYRATQGRANINWDFLQADSW